MINSFFLHDNPKQILEAQPSMGFNPFSKHGAQARPSAGWD
jgi:hypothetical protein